MTALSTVKKCYFSLLFLVCITKAASAQITLEHVYPFRSVTRVFVSGAGERYYAVTTDTLTQTGTLHWFDGNHVPLNTVQFDLPESLFGVSVNHRSAHFFDDDPGIEFSILWVNATFNPVNRVIDDDGTVISEDISGLLSYFTEDGVNKILTGHEVYIVPGFSVQHSFLPNLASTTVIEGEGRKFWYRDQASENVVMLNEDYSPYRTFDLNLDVPNGCGYNIFCYSKFQTNGDEKIEWAYQYDCSGSLVYRFFSDSDLLFEIDGSIPDNIFATVVPAFYGLDASKIFVYYFGSNGTDSIQVHDLASQNKEHVFQGSWAFTNSGIGSLKYYPTSVPGTQGSFEVLNSDYSTWATFPNYNVLQLSLQGVSIDLFDTDPNTKEVFAAISGPNGLGHAIWRSNGTVLFEVFHTLTYGQVSSIPGLPNKLIFVNPALGAPNNESHVYSIPSTSPVAVEEVQERAVLSFSALPNPFSGTLNLDFSTLKDPVAEIRVTDVTGRLVYQKNTPVENRLWELPGADRWPQGIYFVQIRSGSGIGVQKVIRQ